MGWVIGLGLWGISPRFSLNRWLKGATAVLGALEKKPFLILWGNKPQFLLSTAHGVVNLPTTLRRLLRKYFVSRHFCILQKNCAFTKGYLWRYLLSNTEDHTGSSSLSLLPCNLERPAYWYFWMSDVKEQGLFVSSGMGNMCTWCYVTHLLIKDLWYTDNVCSKPV